MAKSFAKVPNSKQFLPILSAGVPKVMLFLGEEAGEKEKMIARIASQLKDKFGSDVSPSRFHSESDDVLKCAEFVLSESMFMPVKMAILYDADKVKEKDRSYIKDMSENIPDSSYLVMTTLEKRVPYQLEKILGDSVQSVIFWPLFENELQSYIISEIKKGGKSIDVQGALRLILLLGRDMEKVDAAIERLLLGVDSERIGERDVVDLIADERDVTVFEFINLLFKKEKSSIRYLVKMLDDGVNELLILTMITKEAELLEAFLSGRTDSESRIDAKKSEVLQEYSRHFRSEELKKLFTHIYLTELALKSGGSRKDVMSNPLLELVSELISADNRKKF